MTANNKTHDNLVADWKANAEKHDDDNYWFLRSLKQKSGKKVDRIALELHQEAFSIVDCMKCANCCRTLRPIVTEEDIARIAGHLGMARDEFVAAYLERDEEQDRYLSTMNHASNAVVCPAVFYLVEQMRKRMKR